MKIELFYPSFTRKALTFTIDDGNMTYDRMLLDILKPVGIKGTFNLCSNLHKGREEQTCEFYEGYGIANHCKYHPLVNFDGKEYILSDEPFDPEKSSAEFIYRVNGKDGFFWCIRPNGWREMIYESDFKRYADECHSELNAIFGEGTVKDFVWPYGEQDNAVVKEHVKSTYRSVRKTGCTYDLDGFAIPRDKKAWSYNADHTNLLDVMRRYEEYPDDGGLKFFAFGVHSVDFERANKWEDLKTFARMYGNRHDTYWYASVEDIFDYEEAIELLCFDNSRIENKSHIPLYISVDGEKRVLAPGEILIP